MNEALIEFLKFSNPWFVKEQEGNIIDASKMRIRIQLDKIILPAWDPLCIVLTGPRQSGKTTLGLLACQKIIEQQRFSSLLYLNCDEFLIREWLHNPTFIKEASEVFNLYRPIIFIDEVQRLPSPGLLLKSIIDLQLPIKLLVSGSSQLEIRSKVQEFLTGRHFEVLVLPFSYIELQDSSLEQVLYGCYPGIVEHQEKSILLKRLYDDYMNKDIINLLKVGYPDVMRKLIVLMAHSSGQLVNFQHLASDAQVSTPTIKNYLELLEKTYMLVQVAPFVGNKRKEITSNPIYYFIDNGFRNCALRNFSALEVRNDTGFLVESVVFQELLKFKVQYFLDFNLYFWRTQSGAEVDFVLYVNETLIIPIEVKYRHSNQPAVTKSFRSFIDAYKPKIGFFITKDFYGAVEVAGCNIYFRPLSMLLDVFKILQSIMAY